KWAIPFSMQAPLIELQMRNQTATDVITYYYSYMRHCEYGFSRFPSTGSKEFWKRVWSNAEARSPRIQKDISREKERARRQQQTPKLADIAFRAWQKQVQKRAIKKFDDFKRWHLEVAPNAEQIYQSLLGTLGLEPKS